MTLLADLRAALPEGAAVRIRMARNRDSPFDATLYLSPGGISGRDVGRQLRAHEKVAAAAVLPDHVEVRFTDEAIREARDAIASGGLQLTMPASLAPRYLVKFCDPNATKALHVGHIRNIALGNALASLFELAGADVTRVSVVCDTGRSAAEAVAGYLEHHRHETPASLGVPGDVFVGRCYRDYARGAAPDSDGPDHDGAGLGDDPAQAVMEAMRRGDDATTGVWMRLRGWVLDGHACTLARLQVRAPAPVFESEVGPHAELLVEEALRCGVFRVRADSTVEMPWADPDRDGIAMRRPDGSITGYMRHFAIWSDLQRVHEAPIGCINIVGDEWIPFARAREKPLARMHPCPLYDAFRSVGVGMLRLDGETMKSREGPVVLVADLLDEVAASAIARDLAADVAAAEPLAAAIVKCHFLNVPAAKAMDFSLARVLNERENPGWSLVRAWLGACGQGETGDADAVDLAEERLLVLRGSELAPVWEVALRTCDVRPVVAHLRHIAEERLRAPNAGSARLVAAILRRGMDSIGLLPLGDRQPVAEGAVA